MLFLVVLQWYDYLESLVVVGDVPAFVVHQDYDVLSVDGNRGGVAPVRVSQVGCKSAAILGVLKHGLALVLKLEKRAFQPPSTATAVMENIDDANFAVFAIIVIIAIIFDLLIRLAASVNESKKDVAMQAHVPPHARVICNRYTVVTSTQ